jgi:PAS domain-containing protein
VHFEEFVEHQIQDRTLSRSYAFIALPSNEDLIKTLDRGLDRLRADGRYDALYDTWMEHYQPRRAPMSRSLRTALWVLGVAGAMMIFVGLWQVMLRRELRRRTRALRESETKYRAIFEHSHDAILLLELGPGRVLEANDRACELFGHTRAQLIGSSFLQIEPNVLSEPTSELRATSGPMDRWCGSRSAPRARSSAPTRSCS